MDEERRLLEELASPEALLDAFLPAEAGVYVKDRDGRYLMVNATGAANVGHTPEELVGRTDRELFPGQLGERLVQTDQAILAAGESRTIEEPLIVGGRLRTYLSTKAPLRDASGAVIGLVGVSTDVTSLHETDEEIRRREAQLAEAQALTRIGSWEWEVSTGELIWSDETYRIFGLDHGETEPTYEAYLERVHPDDRRPMTEAVDKSRAPGSDGTFELEHRIVRTDGEERICSCHGRMFFDLDGTPLRMIGAVQDVTDQRRMHAELVARELQLRTAQELTAIGSWDWDPVADRVTWSAGLYRMFGLDPDEFEGTFQAYLDRVHPDDRAAQRRRVVSALAGQEPDVGDARIVRRDGEVRMMRSSMRLLRDDDGQPVRLIGACEDITGQRRDASPGAERMRRILDTAHEAFVAMDADGCISEWNQAAEEAFGWPRDEAIGSVFADRVIPPPFREQFRAGLRRFLETGAGPVLDSDHELSALHRDGHEIPVELTISALESDGRWEFHAFVRDISERKRVEAERSALIEKLDSLAHTDELTGLWNRRAWDEQLSRELARAARDGVRLSVAMLDLDGFKAYNDNHGHQAGDELLRDVATSWREQLRVTDVLARYGGEEFAVAFPACPLDTALPVVERLRVDIPAGQTCSAGLVAWNGEESAEELVGRADDALYEAKRAGRDQTVARP